MATLKLTFFGSPQVVRNGELLDIGASKAMGLLAYLAVTGQNHSRDALGTLLWPDHDQSRARTYLRHALWSLKKELGEEWLHISREQIGFQASDDVWLDVAVFREKVTAVSTHDHPPGQICSDCLAHLQAAVSLYHENFLTGFTLTDSPAFDEWQFFQTEELRQSFAGALERLVQEYDAKRDYEPAISYARRWLSLDQLHEPVHRTLMRLYALAGQQAAALRQYQECVRLLDEELGIEPEDETVTLYEIIRSRQLERLDSVKLAKSAVNAEIIVESEQEYDLATLADYSSTATLFVAREQELARLDKMLRLAFNGQPQVACILGEAGQGKTALLQAFARRAQEIAPNLIVAGGNCNAYTGMGDPYLPFREILALLTADREGSSLITPLQPELSKRVNRLLPKSARILVETAPDLIDTLVPRAGLLERTDLPHLSEKPWRRQLLKQHERGYSTPGLTLHQNALLEQYARLIQKIAHQVPLLLMLDDLQWADPGSVSLLFHLGRTLSGCPAFIVGAYRPDEVAIARAEDPHPLGRVVNELQRIYGDILIDLGEAEGEAFIDAWLDNEPNRFAPFFRQSLYRQTGGHPLFTIELLRAMRERGDLQQDDEGVWVMQPSINWRTIPARVEGAIEERINRLEPTLQEMLQVASIEGEEFTAEVVANVLKLDERDTVRLLSRELDKLHVLVRAIGTRHTGERRLSRYRFRHFLIQHYLYNLLDDVERIYQHEAVGNALEILHEDQISEVAVQLAWHFEIAQLPEKAATYLLLAGDQARRAAALTEAIQHYQAALSRWPDEDDAGRAGLLRKLGECQWMTGHANDALETLEIAYKLFQALGDEEEAGAVQRLIGRVYWERGNREKSLHYYHRALSILEKLPDSVELAWAISSISQMHMNADEYDQAIEWGNQALALARKLKAEPVIVHILNNLGTSNINIGDVEKGREMLEESIHRALAGNLPHDAGRGRLNLGETLASRDYYEEARAKFNALYEQASRVHTTLYAGSALVELARLDWLNGRWQSALSRKSSIEKWLEEGQSVAYLRVIASTVFGHQYNDLGQPELAYTILNNSESEVRDFDEIQLMSPHLTQIVRAMATLGKDAETKTVTCELLNMFARANYISRFTTLPLLHICEALPTNVLEELIDSVVEILQNLEQDENNIQVPSRRAAVHELQGIVARVQKRADQAVAAFRDAVKTWRTVERPYDQARAFKNFGEALVLAGEESESLEMFSKGEKLIEDLAAQLDDDEKKAAFLQAPLAQAIEDGLHNLKT